MNVEFKQKETPYGYLITATVQLVMIDGKPHQYLKPDGSVIIPKIKKAKQ